MSRIYRNRFRRRATAEPSAQPSAPAPGLTRAVADAAASFEVPTPSGPSKGPPPPAPREVSFPDADAPSLNATSQRGGETSRTHPRRLNNALDLAQLLQNGNLQSSAADTDPQAADARRRLSSETIYSLRWSGVLAGGGTGRRDR